MDNQRLIHDAAVAMTAALIEIFGPVLRDEERNDAMQEMYHVCKTGIESYVIQRNRELARMNPSRN